MNTNEENYTGQGARVRVNENQDAQRYVGTEESIVNTPKNAEPQDNDDFLQNDQDDFYPNDQNNVGAERSQNTTTNDDDDDFIINSADDDDDDFINSDDDTLDDDDNFDDDETFADDENDPDNLNRLGRDGDVNRTQDDSFFGTNRNESL